MPVSQTHHPLLPRIRPPSFRQVRFSPTALWVLVLLAAACTPRNMEPPVLAPFQDLDRICTNDWWNRAPNPIHNVKADRDRVIAFGMYTVMNGTLKLSAQLYPLYPWETRTVRLEVQKEGLWEEIGREEVNDLGWSALFRVEGRDATRDVAYRLRHGKKAPASSPAGPSPSARNPVSHDTIKRYCQTPVLPCNHGTPAPEIPA